MLSTNELKAEITRKGETVKSVSSKMGMNRATFYRKMCGVSDFTRAEISQLVEILGLSDTVTMKIFLRTRLRKNNKERMMDGHAWQEWRDTPKGGKQ